MPYFSKAVHVELPNKRTEVAVLEVLGQNFLGEDCDIFNIEGVAGGCPTDDGRYLSILNQMGATSTISCSFVMNRDV